MSWSWDGHSPHWDVKILARDQTQEMKEYWQTWCDKHTRRSAITPPESAPSQAIVCVGEAEPSDPQPAPNESDSTLVSSEISQSEIEKDEIADWIVPEADAVPYMLYSPGSLAGEPVSPPPVPTTTRVFTTQTRLGMKCSLLEHANQSCAKEICLTVDIGADVAKSRLLRWEAAGAGITRDEHVDCGGIRFGRGLRLLA